MSFYSIVLTSTDDPPSALVTIEFRTIQPSPRFIAALDELVRMELERVQIAANSGGEDS